MSVRGSCLGSHGFLGSDDQGRCTSLSEYHQHFEAIRPQLARFVARIETNFVSLEVHRTPNLSEDRFIWLPCEGGHRRVSVKLIDKVVAEGDYMRVRVGEGAP